MEGEELRGEVLWKKKSLLKKGLNTLLDVALCFDGKKGR